MAHDPVALSNAKARAAPIHHITGRIGGRDHRRWRENRPGAKVGILPVRNFPYLVAARRRLFSTTGCFGRDADR